MRHLKLFLLFVMIAFGGVQVSSQDTEWTLIWSDEFDGSGRPNPDNWNYHVGSGWNNGANSFLGWGNNELEWYRPQNCYVAAGNLVIKAEYLSRAASIENRDWPYRSCRITTDTKQSFTYGAVEARIKLPAAEGTWPAFWMLGDVCDDTSTHRYRPALTHYDVMSSNWSSCGEIDILEHKNDETYTVHNLFWDTREELLGWTANTNANKSSVHEVGDVTEFHIYRLEWTPEELRWLVDDEVAKRQDITADNMEEFHRPFHVILNLALGGAFTGNTEPNLEEFPFYMRVDYVRIYAH